MFKQIVVKGQSIIKTSGCNCIKYNSIHGNWAIFLQIFCARDQSAGPADIFVDINLTLKVQSQP